MDRNSIFKNFDWLTFVLYLSLTLIGWMMIYAAEYPGDESEYVFTLSSGPGKQLIWLIVSYLSLITVFFIESKFWNTFAYPIYFVLSLLLVLVLFIGVSIKGSTSWFSFFGFSFQPSEFAKLGTALALASYLSYYKTNLKNRKAVFISVGIIIGPAVLVLLQPDAGSAIVFTSFFIALFREGLAPWIYIAVFILAALFITAMIYPLSGVFLMVLYATGGFILSHEKRPISWWSSFAALGIFDIVALSFGWNEEALVINGLFLLTISIFSIRKAQFRILIMSFPIMLFSLGFAFSSKYLFDKVLKPHQQDRINVWLRPELSDPRGSLYNLLQSKRAIASGGIQGKGFLNGELTKLDYVPEQSTDFIYSTIGEEQGFIGAFAIVILFLIMLFRITLMGERARAPFGRVFAYGLAGLIFFHFFINIGMTMGLLPVIGIPLPFISKGGTSLLAFSIMIGILLKLDASRYQY